MEQSLVNWLFGGVSAVLGWFGKVLWDAVTSLQKDLKDIERELHVNYVSKDDYKQDIQEIKYMIKQNNDEVKDIMKQIFERLDKKADK